MVAEAVNEVASFDLGDGEVDSLLVIFASDAV